MPLALEVRFADGRRMGVVHAELPILDWQQVPDMVQDENDQEHLIWSRQRIKSLKNQMLSETTPDQVIQPVANINAVISGHTIVDEGRQVWGNWFYIDGGAFLGNALTLMTDQDVTRDLGTFAQMTYGDHYQAMMERLDNQWDEALLNTKPRYRPPQETE